MMEIGLRSDFTVTLVQHTGSDEMICWAARVSTVGAGSLETTESRGLINYLMRDRHGSPFEHGSLTFMVEAPIFVFREFHRHRAGWSYNEESARYRELGPVFYVPGPDRPLQQVGKPGAYTFTEGTTKQTRVVGMVTKLVYRTCWRGYKLMLKFGVAREVARIVLPVGIYSSMYATCNPRSLMHFLGLRTKDLEAAFPSFPQYEIEKVARQMEYIFAELYPHTYEAWVANGRVAP